MTINNGEPCKDERCSKATLHSETYGQLEGRLRVDMTLVFCLVESSDSLKKLFWIELTWILDCIHAPLFEIQPLFSIRSLKVPFF